MHVVIDISVSSPYYQSINSTLLKVPLNSSPISSNKKTTYNPFSYLTYVKATRRKLELRTKVLPKLPEKTPNYFLARMENISAKLFP